MPQRITNQEDDFGRVPNDHEGPCSTEHRKDSDGVKAQGSVMSAPTSERVRCNILRALYEESKGYASNVGGLWACSVCGCLDVQIRTWRIANTGEVTEDEGPCADLWCPSCETNESQSTACMVRIERGKVVCTEHDDCQVPGRVHRYPIAADEPKKASQ